MREGKIKCFLLTTVTSELFSQVLPQSSRSVACDYIQQNAFGKLWGCFFSVRAAAQGPITLQAQEFKLFDRTVQVHGFVSQGFVYTDNNNWLTMNTNEGSAAFSAENLFCATPPMSTFMNSRVLYPRISRVRWWRS